MATHSNPPTTSRHPSNMTTPTLTAVLALIGTGLAFTAGVLGGIFGGILLLGHTILITVAGFVIGAEAYDKGYQEGIKDAQPEDVYE